MQFWSKKRPAGYFSLKGFLLYSWKVKYYANEIHHHRKKRIWKGFYWNVFKRRSHAYDINIVQRVFQNVSGLWFAGWNFQTSKKKNEFLQRLKQIPRKRIFCNKVRQAHDTTPPFDQPWKKERANRAIFASIDFFGIQSDRNWLVFFSIEGGIATPSLGWFLEVQSWFLDQLICAFSKIHGGNIGAAKLDQNKSNVEVPLPKDFVAPRNQCQEAEDVFPQRDHKLSLRQTRRPLHAAYARIRGPSGAHLQGPWPTSSQERMGILEVVKKGLFFISNTILQIASTKFSYLAISTHVYISSFSTPLAMLMTVLEIKYYVFFTNMFVSIVCLEVPVFRISIHNSVIVGL